MTAFIMISSAGCVEFYRRPCVRLYIGVAYVPLEYMAVFGWSIATRTSSRGTQH